MDKLLLWDLDKTLTDVWWHTDKLLQTILERDKINYFKDYILRFRDSKMEWRPIKERLILLFWEEKWSKYFEEFKSLKKLNESVPLLFPWIEDTLKLTVWKVNNIVVTNKEWELATQDIEWNKIGRFFTKIVTSSDIWNDNDRLKPSPDLVNIWINWYNPNFVTMIWDTANDINAIISSRVRVEKKVGILAWWGNTKKTLEEQKNRINWTEWKDYIIIPTIEKLWEYLLKTVL